MLMPSAIEQARAKVSGRRNRREWDRRSGARSLLRDI
jgi:hypothetical protein